MKVRSTPTHESSFNFTFMQTRSALQYESTLNR